MNHKLSGVKFCALLVQLTRRFKPPGGPQVRPKFEIAKKLKAQASAIRKSALPQKWDVPWQGSINAKLFLAKFRGLEIPFSEQSEVAVSRHWSFSGQKMSLKVLCASVAIQRPQPLTESILLASETSPHPLRLTQGVRYLQAKGVPILSIWPDQRQGVLLEPRTINDDLLLDPD